MFFFSFLLPLLFPQEELRSAQNKKQEAYRVNGDNTHTLQRHKQHTYTQDMNTHMSMKATYNREEKTHTRREKDVHAGERRIHGDGEQECTCWP